MRKTALACAMTLPLGVLAARLPAQVETEAPPVVLGAKPVTVERIMVHGTVVQGNTRTADDRRRLRAGRCGDDRRAP